MSGGKAVGKAVSRKPQQAGENPENGEKAERKKVRTRAKCDNTKRNNR